MPILPQVSARTRRAVGAVAAALVGLTLLGVGAVLWGSEPEADTPWWQEPALATAPDAALNGRPDAALNGWPDAALQDGPDAGLQAAWDVAWHGALDAALGDTPDAGAHGPSGPAAHRAPEAVPHDASDHGPHAAPQAWQRPWLEHAGDDVLARRPAVLPSYHRVEPGDTLSKIARRYGIDREELIRRNAIEDDRTLAPGTRLVLPEPDTAQPPSPEAAARKHPDVEAVLVEAAEEFGWSAATVQAVAWVESRWTQAAVSTEGAVGVLQVQPATGEKMSTHLGQDVDLYDLEDNATAGVAYLDLLHERYDGDLRATLAAYHQGPTSYERDGVLRVSEVYIARILEARTQFRE